MATKRQHHQRQRHHLKADTMTLKSVLRTLICCVALPVLGAAPSFAEEAQRQLGAHEHGTGTFDLAIDRTYVVGELRVPRMDIIGFETVAKTTDERIAFVKGMQDLHKPELLFAFPAAAECTFDFATVGVEDNAKAGSKTAKAEDHDHDHGAEKAEAAKDDHDHDHDHGDAKSETSSDGETHSEFAVKYAWTCTKPAALAEMSFPYFKSFPKAKKLTVQVVRDGAQAQHTATADAATIPLPQAP